MKYAPSNADVWVNCSAAPALQASHPLPAVDKEASSDTRMQGKAFDWLVKECYDTDVTPKDHAGEVSPQGVLVDDELVEAVTDYLKILDGRFSIEQKIKLDFLKPGQVGFCDAIRIDQKTKTIEIIDAKYGHSYVDEFENMQLLCYLLGVVASSLNDDTWGEWVGWQFKLSIFQPRCFSASTFRTWEGDIQDDVIFAALDRLTEAVKESQSGSTVATPGAHCRKCDARHACSAFQRATYDGLDYTSDTVAMDLDNEALALEYRILKDFESLLKGRLSGIEQDVEARMQRGESIPGVTMSSGRTSEKWADGCIDEVSSILELLDHKDYAKPRQLKTPKQIVKLGVDREVIKDYINTQQGKKSLAITSSKLIRKTFKV